MEEYNDDQIYSGKNFSGKQFSNIEWDNCQFENCSFSEVLFKSCSFLDCCFEQCDLSNMLVTDSRFNTCQFVNSKIMGVNWGEANKFLFIEFKSSILNFSIFSNLKLSKIVFEKCKMQDVDLAESDLRESIFCQSELTRASFNGSDLSGSDFRDAKNYFINPVFTKVKKAKFSLPEAISLLSAFEIEIN